MNVERNAELDADVPDEPDDHQAPAEGAVETAPASPSWAPPMDGGTPALAVWPPPPAGYEKAVPQTLSDKYLSPRPLAIWIYAGLVLYTILDFVSLAFHQAGIAGEVGAAMVDTASLIPMIGTFILLLVWTHRTYGNLKAFGATGLMATPAMAVGYHFIPLLAVYKPFQIYDEIARASDPRSPPTLQSTSRGLPVLNGGLRSPGSDRKSRRRSRTALGIVVWAIFYIVNNVVSLQYMQSTFQHQQTQGDIPLLSALSLIENLALASVVYTITKRQDEKSGLGVPPIGND